MVYVPQSRWRQCGGTQAQAPRDRTLILAGLVEVVARGLLSNGMSPSTIRANKPEALSTPITAERRDEGPKRGRCSFVKQNSTLPEQSLLSFDAQRTTLERTARL